MPAEPSGKRRWSVWQESLLLLVIAVLLAVLVKHFLVQAFYIPSESMEPQFVENDRILVQKVSYWRDEPRRGDIVVFEDPGGWLKEAVQPANPIARVLGLIGLYPSGGHLVKRVIGVGGDHVVCCDKQGRITVNDHALDESSYLPKGTRPSSDQFDITVPLGRLWVMGDNRDHSSDSRMHLGSPGGAYVAEDLVVGRVWALIWPLGRAEIIERPNTYGAIPTPEPSANP